MNTILIKFLRISKFFLNFLINHLKIKYYEILKSISNNEKKILVIFYS